MIALMVVGTFVAIIGAALAGRALRLIAVILVAALAGVILGFVDLHDDDTRPGLEIVAVVVAPMLLFTLPGLGQRKRRARPVFTPAAQPQQQQEQPRATAAKAEDIAARLRQLDQLKESGLLDEAAYDEQRRRILAEL
jgi:hypothetical protein